MIRTKAARKLSEAEELEITALMMTNHNCLCPQIFSADGRLLPLVREKLEETVFFLKKNYLQFFPLLKIKDIVLQGSICSYIYSRNSDLDVFIIVEEIGANDVSLEVKILNAINRVLPRLNMKPSFYEHPLDFAVLHQQMLLSNQNCYSLLNDCWTSTPVRQEFAFTPQELYRAYTTERDRLHRFADELPQAENFLTEDGADALQRYLHALRNKAFLCKQNSFEHEYSLDYNLYRCLKRFGIWAHYQKYIYDSRNNLPEQNQ